MLARAGWRRPYADVVVEERDKMANGAFCVAGVEADSESVIEEIRYGKDLRNRFGQRVNADLHSASQGNIGD